MSLINNGRLVVEQITERLGQSSDFICRHLKIDEELSVTCIYFSTIVTRTQVDEMILKPLTEALQKQVTITGHPIDRLKTMIPLGQKKECSGLTEGIQNLLEGHCLLIPDHSDSYLSYDVSKGEYRTISEPSTEAASRGPREGFIEGITTNVALIRILLSDLQRRLQCT